MEIFVKNSVKATIAIGSVIALCVAAFGNLVWAAGFLLAVLWSNLNLLVTVNLLKIALLKQGDARLKLLLLIKFPLLYIFGFWILSLRIFPMWSILLGLLPIFLVSGALRLCIKNCQI